MHADTEGVATEMLSQPWLRRSVNTTEFLQERSLFANELQVKICLNTYKLFYLVNTEDTLVRNKINRLVSAKKMGYNRAARTADAKKWTREGYLTKEQQNAAAAAAAEAKELLPHPSSVGAAPAQASPPGPTKSITPAPLSEAQRSTDATPNPPSVVLEQSTASEVKIEPLPTFAIDGGEAMDVDPSEATSPVAETKPEEPTVGSEDVEMADA